MLPMYPSRLQGRSLLMSLTLSCPSLACPMSVDQIPFIYFFTRPQLLIR
jgi:hypothetical protein